MNTAYLDGILFEDNEAINNILIAMDYVLAETSYRDMTVKRVCCQANISRPTFYRYFKNLDEAADWHMKQSVKKGVYNIGRLLTWSEGLYVTLSCSLRLKNIVKALGNAEPNTTQVHDSLFFDVYFSSILETLALYKRVQLTDELEFLARSWVYALTLDLDWWRERNFDIPIPKLVEYLEQCVPPRLHVLLQEPTKVLPGTRHS